MRFIETWNVKVKDIEKVHHARMSKLIHYWEEGDFYDSDPNDEDDYSPTMAN